MYFAISDALDSQLVILVGGLITLVGTANWLLLRSIRRDTRQVNDAVNHKADGEPTLKQQVDSVKGDMFDLKKDVKHTSKKIEKIDDVLVAMLSYLVRREDAKDLQNYLKREGDRLKP